MPIAITSSFRDNLTWRKFPNKEENDKFYDRHLANCRRHGIESGHHDAGLRWRRHRANATMQAQEDLAEIFQNQTYTYGQCNAARNTILSWGFINRLKVADQKWIRACGGKFPEDLWDAYWDGYKEATMREISDPTPIPAAGQLWKAHYAGGSKLIVYVGEGKADFQFFITGKNEIISILHQDWFARYRGDGFSLI